MPNRLKKAQREERIKNQEAREAWVRNAVAEAHVGDAVPPEDILLRNLPLEVRKMAECPECGCAISVKHYDDRMYVSRIFQLAEMLEDDTGAVSVAQLWASLEAILKDEHTSKGGFPLSYDGFVRSLVRHEETGTISRAVEDETKIIIHNVEYEK